MDVNTRDNFRQPRRIGARLVMMASLLVGVPVWADATEEAERFLVLSGAAQAMNQASEMMINQQLQQNPTLIPFRRVMLAYFNKYVSYESLKEEYIALYVERFSEQELKQMNRFYESSVGRKMVQLMPELMEKGAEITARRSDEHFPELQKMMAEEAQRIQSLQDQDDHFNSVLQTPE